VRGVRALSLAFARQAIAQVELRARERVLDVAAGAGGAALAMGEIGALPRSTARQAWSSGSGARSARLAIDARVMDGRRSASPTRRSTPRSPSSA
jgi:hypothetical protein